MFLWHGTYSDCKDEILKDNMIKCFTSTNDTTQEVNELFEANIGYNPRENCIYCSGDTESANGFDYAFKIDTNNLNTNKLFVGDYRLIDDVLCSFDNDEIIKLLQQYTDTLITFDEYLHNKHSYLDRDVWELEFLYFDNIKVSYKDLD